MTEKCQKPALGQKIPPVADRGKNGYDKRQKRSKGKILVDLPADPGDDRAQGKGHNNGDRPEDGAGENADDQCRTLAWSKSSP